MCRVILIAILVLCACVCRAQQLPEKDTGIMLTLARKDRLPNLPGSNNCYTLNRLPSTESRFLVARELFDHSLPGGKDPVYFTICHWDAPMAGAALPEVAIAGQGDRAVDSSGVVTALICSMVMPDKVADSGDRLLIFRDLNLLARIDLPERGMWIAGISSDGQTVCRLDSRPNTAYLFAPGKATVIRTYPGTFLNWEARHGWAMYAVDRAVTMTTADNKPLYTATLPFLAKKATLFDDGTALIGSQPIGPDRLSWRVLLDDKGRQTGEAVFGDWGYLPDELPQGRNVEDNAPAARKLSPCFLSFTGKELEIRYKNTLGVGASQPMSNTVRPQHCVDSRGNVYRLMNREIRGETRAEEPLHYVQSVLTSLIFPVEKSVPRVLIDSNNVAREMEWQRAFIYSMTVSVDGNWLALTVTPDDRRNYTEWWLLQYRIDRKK